MICAAMFVAAALFLLDATAAETAPARLDNHDIYGRWTLTKVLDSAAIASMNDRQASRLVGKQLLIEPDRLSFNGRICRQPGYQRSVEDLARSFREQGHVSANKMGLPDPVTTIDAGCTYLFLKRPDRIALTWDGFYFDAVRTGK